jgi:hypothetical protein
VVVRVTNQGTSQNSEGDQCMVAHNLYRLTHLHKRLYSVCYRPLFCRWASLLQLPVAELVPRVDVDERNKNRSITAFLSFAYIICFCYHYYVREELISRSVSFSYVCGAMMKGYQVDKV